MSFACRTRVPLDRGVEWVGVESFEPGANAPARARQVADACSMSAGGGDAGLMSIWLARSTESATVASRLRLGQRKHRARTIERHRADFIGRRRIDRVQVARGGDRGVAVGAVDDIEAQQLLLGLGERA